MLKLREVKFFPSLHKQPNPSPPSEQFFYRPLLGDNQTLMILDLLERLKPRKCFEWGAGWSTVFFPSFFPEVKWISVEHLPFFVNFLRPHLPPNAVIIQKNLFEGYVEEALKWVENNPFDFAFVDGERRDECVLTASIILRKGGIVIKHDSPQDVPIMLDGKDVGLKFEEHGAIQSLWWARK